MSSNVENETTPISIEQLLDWNFSLIALQPNAKKPLHEWVAYTHRRPNDEEQTLLLDGYTGQVGIFVGKAYGLAVLDFDSTEAMNSFFGDHPVPKTMTVKSHRGVHLYLEHPGVDLNYHVPGITKMEVKTSGYMVAPGSVHPEGTVYEFTTSFEEAGIAVMDQWIINRIGIRTAASDPSELSTETSSTLTLDEPGSRNNALYEAGQVLGIIEHAGGIERATAVSILLEASPLPESEAIATINSGMDSKKASAMSESRMHMDYFDDPALEQRIFGNLLKLDPALYEATHAAAGRWLVHLYGEYLRYDHDQACWFIWTGRVWRADRTCTIKRIAIDASVLREVSVKRLSDDTTDMRKHLRSLRNMGAVKSILEFAQSLPPVATNSEVWNKQPNLLAVRNGIIDLRTKELRQAIPEDMISRIIDEDYDPAFLSPRWNQFLLEISDDRSELVHFMQLSAGYSATGETRERKFFLMCGNGTNGKSQYLTAIRHSLGEYCVNTAFDTFDSAAKNQHKQSLDRLDGARFVTVSESDYNARFNVGRMKEVAGNEPITTRGMYKGDRQFMPVFKLWFSFNTRPEVLDDTDGFWNRCIIIPFDVSFKDRIDYHLEEKLALESKGILSWIVDGAFLWYQSEGLHKEMPGYLLTHLKEYREESDPLASFISECIDDEDGVQTSASELYVAYCEYSDSIGLPHSNRLSLRIFGEMMKKRIPYKRSRKGFVYLNVMLKVIKSKES